MSEVEKFSIEELQEYLVELGKILCKLLEFLPSKEISVAIKVTEDCILEFMIAKR